MSACSAGRDRLVTANCYKPSCLAESGLLVNVLALETDLINDKVNASTVRYRTDRFVPNH